MVIKQIIEPKLEPIFDSDSFGYRPGRSAHQSDRFVSSFAAKQELLCSSSLRLAFLCGMAFSFYTGSARMLIMNLRICLHK